MWGAIKSRKRTLRVIKYRLDLNRVRIAACDRQMIRIPSLGHESYKMLWKQKFDYWQECLVLERSLQGRDNLFWVVTGKRFTLYLRAKRLFSKLKKCRFWLTKKRK